MKKKTIVILFICFIAAVCLIAAGQLKKQAQGEQEASAGPQQIKFISTSDIHGIGFGTAAATLIRCAITVIYIMAKTDIYHCHGVKARGHEVKDILRCGCPDAANMMMLAIQNYFVMMIIISSFGDVGATIKGVLFFSFNIANIVILGMMSSMRPLMGLYAGAGDTRATRNLLQQCIVWTIILVGIITLVVELFPELFYHLNGVKTMPNGGVLSIRLFALYFVIKGMDALFRLYFANRKDTLAATGLTILGNATLPLFAFALAAVFSTPFIWLGYLMMELLIFGLSLWRYLWWLKKDQADGSASEKVLYITVRPEEAVEASRMIRRFAEENGCSIRIAYRMALCMEEMAAYVVQSQKRSDVSIMIMAKFKPEEGTFCMIDDGQCIALNEDSETAELITDNYGLIKKLARSVEYRYILNMNYTIIRF